MPWRTSPVTLVLAGTLLTGCSSQPCGELPRLQAEREQRRAEQLRLGMSGTASAEEIGAADDRLHAFERRVYELEQSCERS